MQRNTMQYNATQHYVLHIISDQRIVKICGHAACFFFYNPKSNNMCNLVSFEKRYFFSGVSNLQLEILGGFYVLISSFKNCEAAIHQVNAHVCVFKYTWKLTLENGVFYIIELNLILNISSLCDASLQLHLEMNMPLGEVATFVYVYIKFLINIAEVCLVILFFSILLILKLRFRKNMIMLNFKI